MRCYAVVAVLLLVACAPPNDLVTPPDGGGDTSKTPDGSAAETGSTAPTYTKDVQPILKMKCGPCHDGQTLGKQDLAANYADAMKPVPKAAQDATDCWYDQEMTMPKTIGECAVISVKRGWMPYQKGCDQPMPIDPSACLSKDQITILEKWVAAGMPE